MGQVLLLSKADKSSLLADFVTYQKKIKDRGLPMTLTF